MTIERLADTVKLTLDRLTAGQTVTNTAIACGTGRWLTIKRPLINGRHPAVLSKLLHQPLRVTMLL